MSTVSKTLYRACDQAQRRAIKKRIDAIVEKRDQARAVAARLRVEAWQGHTLLNPPAKNDPKLRLARRIEQANEGPGPNDTLACAECGRQARPDGTCPCWKTVA